MTQQVPDATELLRLADPGELGAYCTRNSDDGGGIRVTFEPVHRNFIATNRNGKVFGLSSSEVGAALMVLWASSELRKFESYDEKVVRSVVRGVLGGTWAGSLAESQTRPVWEVLRIAGGFVKKLGIANPSRVFSEV